jgi:hypothetical protein
VPLNEVTLALQVLARSERADPFLFKLCFHGSTS